VVRLSKDEREMAQMMGMTDQEYAKNKLALVKEGKLN
jgi:phage I-like protein